MANRNKTKGTLAETAVVGFLRSNFPTAERRALAGRLDKGDIANIPNCVIEVKAHGSYDISGWMTETDKERANARAQFGILVVKPRGIGAIKVGKWWAIMTLEEASELIVKATNESE